MAPLKTYPKKSNPFEFEWTEGFDPSVDVKALAKDLKSRLATGGTLKGRSIELQGDQRERAKATLIKMGYPEEGIDIR